MLKNLPTLASAVVGRSLGLMLALTSTAIAADYSIQQGPDATLGLWTIWQTAANEYMLELRLDHEVADPTEIQLWNVSLGWDPAKLEAVNSPVEGDVFAGFGNRHFNFYEDPGSLTCTGVLLGLNATHQPADGSLLFSQLYHAIDPAGGPASISLGLCTLRDGDNQDVTHLNGPDVDLAVDVTPPIGYTFSLQAFLPAGNTVWTSQQLVEVLTSVGDGTLDAFQLNETAPLIPNAAAGWMAPPLPVEFTLGAGDGFKLVYLHLRDLYGNRMTITDGITLDTQAPVYHITEFEARPRHEGVLLTWINPTAPDFDHVRVYRGHWTNAPTSSYPEYDDDAPMDAYPLTETSALSSGFQLAYSGAAESWLDPIVPRDVYRYVGFAVDHALNVGAGHAEARDRSTNYILGDTRIPYDGTVFAQDLLLLANSFYRVEGEAFYVAEIDYGPTDDASRAGIPLTDNKVGFEDLMIFAMNYGLYGPPAPEDSLSGLAGVEVGVIHGERSVLVKQQSAASAGDIEHHGAEGSSGKH